MVIAIDASKVDRRHRSPRLLCLYLSGVSRAPEVTKYFSRRMKLLNESLNPWMLTTIGILLIS